MTAKEYLGQFYNLSLRIKTLRDEIAAIEAERDAIAITIDGLPRGSGQTSDRTGRLAARLADKLAGKQEELQKLNIRYWSQRQVIVRQINALDDARYSRILYLRYVQGEDWEQIATELGYTYRHVTRMHGYALLFFSKNNKDVLECPIE